MRLGRILVANDFSPASAAALELAAQLGRRFRSTVEVLHVRDGGTAALDEPAQMHRCVRSLERRGVQAVGSSELGDPIEVILRHAEGCDLIVMGTHGRQGLNRLVNGSVAEAVLRRAPCPVLTAREHETEVAHVG
jgi:nucleotide-binding universal stress UspA family protein